MAQIYLNNDNRLSLIEKWILSGCGVFFIVLPLIANLIQLHHAIQVWISDKYSKYTVQTWIRSYLRILYTITILTGSAFAAVDICNSNIFHLPWFNMGLNKRQKALFKNQRILSTVLMENIPQLILQGTYLYFLSVKSNISMNVDPITIIAMIFSASSIVLSVFNFKSSSLLIKCEAITMIEMDIESQQLSSMKGKSFRRLIVHHRNPICREIAKIINVNSRLPEILFPIQTSSGTKLIFYIRNDSSDKNLSSNIVSTIRDKINSGELAQVTFIFHSVGCFQKTLTFDG